MNLRLWVPALLCTTACITGPEREYEQVDVETPPAWGTGPALEGELDHEWWRSFGDEALDVQVALALEHNQDLHAAAARVEAAAAQARIAGAALQPTVDASGNASRGRMNFIGLPVPGSSGVFSSTSTTYGVSLDVGWEPDLWGRLAAGEAAALADYKATSADYHGARLSLVAQLSKTWFALAEAQLQADLARSTVQSYEQNAEFIRRRYSQGRVRALDLHLGENTLATARALLDAREEQLTLTRRQLQILTGAYPDGSLPASRDLPEPGGAVPAGLPSELLQRRPDLAAASERLAAADYRLYAARKALWPSIGLTASGGRSSTELDDLLDSNFDVWSLAGGIVLPIFQGGRLRAAIDAADARAREALASFGQSSLRAFAEVEGALATQDLLDARVGHLGVAAREAQAAEELAREQYGKGRGDILDVLEAQRRSLTADSALLEARRARLENRINLFVALGGGFKAEAE